MLIAFGSSDADFVKARSLQWPASEAAFRTALYAGAFRFPQREVIQVGGDRRIVLSCGHVHHEPRTRKTPNPGTTRPCQACIEAAYAARDPKIGRDYAIWAARQAGVLSSFAEVPAAFEGWRRSFALASRLKIRIDATNAPEIQAA